MCPKTRTWVLELIKYYPFDHVAFSLFSGLGFILSTVSACLCTGLGYKWFLNESSAKYQLCEAPDVQFCFFETLAQRCRFNSTIITGSVLLYGAACKYWDSDIFFRCFGSVLRQMALKWNNNWDLSADFQLKGGLRVFLSMLFTSCVGVEAFFVYFCIVQLFNSECPNVTIVSPMRSNRL